MNGFEERAGWRDEDGCGRISNGNYSRRIARIEDKEYLIFVIERLIRLDNRQHIIGTEVNVAPDEEVNLIDADGNTAQFYPIGIIHHRGGIIGDRTHGHFLADVKNKHTNKWFRTSDNDPPQDISKSGLTKHGYIFLYKKKTNQQ